MSKSKIFFCLSVSFIAGIALASFYYPKILDSFWLFALLVLGLIIMAVFYGNKITIVAGFSILFFIGGIYITSLKLSELNSLNLDGQNFSEEAVIVKEPEDKEKYQKIIVAPAAWTSGVRKPKILVNIFDVKDYRYGDVLKVSCDLKIPENFDPDFDYRMYLGKDGIFYECKSPKIEKTGENRGNSAYKFILAVKNKFNEKIEKSLPAPQSGLLSGLLLGGDDLLSKGWQEKFSATGMTHIVAVSGYNVTIIAEYLLLAGIFLGLWRPQAFWFAIAGIALFVFMIGLPSSAVRAGVMGGLLLWAAKNGRLANSQNAILLSAAIMLIINPLTLRWDIGFQLSFLATLGIIYFSPFFQKIAVKKFRAFGITEILFLTLSAQIFVLPVILANFGQLSLISPLANILILPIIPISMLLGFLAVVSGFIFEPLARIISWLAYLPLKYETIVIDYLSGLKYSSVGLKLTWLPVILWYVLLLIAVKRINRIKKQKEF